MRSTVKPAQGVRPEHELILCCARTRLDARNAERIRELLREKIDWDDLVAVASRHGVAPLLQRNLAAAAPASIPRPTLALLKGTLVHSGGANLHAASEIFKVLASFEERGVTVIPCKGAALGALAYGSLAFRQDADTHLILRHGDLPEAHELLTGAGYRPALGPEAPGSAAGVPGRYLYERSGHEAMMHLHTQRTLRHLPVQPDLEALHARLETVSVGGRELRTLSVEDALWFLCAEASKHFWGRLLWICDIAELAQVPRVIEWGQVEQRACALGCERMLALGLSLARDLLEAPVPDQALRRAGPPVRALVARVRRRLFLETFSLPGLGQRLSFRLRMRERPWDGVRYCLRLATTPTEDDWSGLRLPRPLTGLYAVLRPLRLLARSALGVDRPRAIDLAPFVPTPLDMVERMLALAELRPNDVLYDIGCGDGRVVVTAAQRFGVRAVGVDIDPRRIREARSSARRGGVAHLVRILRRDGKTLDLSAATVVTLYLTKAGNMKLRQALRDQLRPGARIVSRDYGLGDWPPDKSESYAAPNGVRATLYLWRVGSEGP